MKNNKLATLVKIIAGLGFITSSISLSHSAEPRSYPLLCKGGGNTTVYTDPAASSHGLTVTIGFNKSTQAATSGLKAGH